MSRRFALLAVYALLLLAGCASQPSGPEYSQMDHDVPDGKSLVVVLRGSSLTGAAWDTDFYLDGTMFTSLGLGAFSQIVVNPGTHVVSSGPKSDPTWRQVEIDMKPGQTYFVQIIRDMPDNFHELCCDAAAKELEKGRYRYQPNIPGH